MDGSILTTTKKILGVEADYTAFDLDIIVHINTVFGTLQQLGIGPVDGFEIDDATALWSDFLGNERPLNPVKSYVYLRVRLLFDPPTSGAHMASMKEQIQELEWRLNVLRETVLYPAPPVEAPYVLDGGSPDNSGGL